MSSEENETRDVEAGRWVKQSDTAVNWSSLSVHRDFQTFGARQVELLEGARTTNSATAWSLTKGRRAAETRHDCLPLSPMEHPPGVRNG